MRNNNGFYVKGFRFLFNSVYYVYKYSCVVYMYTCVKPIAFLIRIV